MQDKGKFRQNMKDQFYTKESVAKKCINQILTLIPECSTYLWIEPSAGSGAFYNNLPSDFTQIGIDIDPKSDGIVKDDYLSWDYPTDLKRQQVIVYGNPPFGRQSSLAKAFIKKSCQFANVIAFILPKSFVKPSMITCFDLKFHCVSSTDLDEKSFLLNESDYDVPCVFQIWQKKDDIRQVEQKVEPRGYTYGNEINYHFAVRRVGVNAGKCFKKCEAGFSPSSHYFLTLHSNRNLETIVELMNRHIFPSNTVGPRSLSQSEINSVLNTILTTLV
jgi:hypothetical protein